MRSSVDVALSETLTIDSTDAPAFDPKLAVPAVRRGALVRTPLVNRLRAAAGTPVVVLVAPAGYGKTTLLSQWSMRDKRPFAWLALDEGDNDAAALTAGLASALDLPRSPRREALPNALSALGPVVLVLDDIHLLRARACVEAVTTLVPYLPSGSTLVLAGRSASRLRLARLRAEGALFELGRDDLALSDREAAVVVRDAGVDLDEEAVARLNARAEGWAAGLYLAALSLRGGSGAEPGGFHGDDRYVTDYIRSEYLADLDPQDVLFLTRTSILAELTGPLCDALLERHDSSRRLEAFEAARQLVVPLDHHRERYRYSGILRDVLRSELERREPSLVAELHRRAADWLEEHGQLECALEHVNELGDTDRAARLIETLALPAYFAGRIDTVERWLGRFDLPRLSRHPAVAILGAWMHVVRGRAADAECWLEAARKGPSRVSLPDGTASTRPWIALLDAAMCPAGLAQMSRDAAVAARGVAPGSPFAAAALLLQGLVLVLERDPGADDVLADAVATARAVGATNSEATALAQRSLLAEAAGDEALAESLAHTARVLVVEHGLEGYSTSAVVFAASARVALRRGDWEGARAHLTAAEKLVPQLTHALPWHSVQTLIELGRSHLALLDVDAARTLLVQAGSILRRRPELGALAEEAGALRRQISVATTQHRHSSLTAAELRLLPLLATHLSFREIGERLFVSRNTVKTQAISVYRKFGVSSRSEAILRAGELGLVDVAQTRSAETV